MKRVVSFAAMEKLFQLMMVPLVLLTVSRLPAWLKLALPLTTCGPVGLDQAGALTKQEAIADSDQAFAGGEMGRCFNWAWCTPFVWQRRAAVKHIFR